MGSLNRPRRFQSMVFNYQEICSDLLKGLPSRVEDIIIRRFGLKGEKRETLESIGKDYDITRERVRQIQEAGLSKLKPRLQRHSEPFQFFSRNLKTTGDLRREDVLLRVLDPKFQNHAFFFLYLGKEFERVSASENFHTLWTIKRDSLLLARKVVGSFEKQLRKANRALAVEDVKAPSPYKPSPFALLSYLEASRKVCQGPEGLWGLREWPEINPRGARDKALLILKGAKKPLHFREITQEINKTRFAERDQKEVLVQTVHNELIRDPRFVLVGRGLYGLRDWGYEPGTTGEVIARILKREGPLSEEEIVKKVLEKRLVKRNTVLQNLRDKQRFKKNLEGKYTLKTK